MWISKKEYKILKENAEKNIDVRVTDLYLIEKSLKELELLEERIIELNKKTDITYVKPQFYLLFNFLNTLKCAIIRPMSSFMHLV